MTHLPTPPLPPGAGAFPPAEMERRFTAFVIDRAVGWGIAAAAAFVVWKVVEPDSGAVVVLAFAGVAVLVGLVLAVLVGTTGLTPGKAATGLRVVRRTTGRPIGLGAALLRTIVLGIAGLPTAGLGLATLAWTAAMDPSRQRRALHDRIGDAVVVDVRPRPVEAAPEVEQPRQIVNLTAMRLLPSPVEEHTPTPTSTPAPTPAATSAPVPPPAPAPTPPVVRTPAAPAPAVPAPAPAAPVPATPSTPPAAPPTPAAPAAPPAATPRLPVEQTRVRPAPGSEPATTPPSPATVRWRVEFDTGEAFVVEGLALVGRRPEPRPGEPVKHVVPLRSSDMSLSKTHAQFQVAPDGALVVMDRGSTNGSYVIRKGMSRSLSPGRPSTLLAGDVVRFGDRSMRVERAEPPQNAAAHSGRSSP
ncbi:RDD family protein [Nocardioides humi]|uniref:FHA domain-containing protein n=1 Tax=Nocardioides humi TaxID=449461 RepID=A0ABN1ZVD7_9ACTN|nr:RDD family protein [Nocardioides humi]